MARVVYHIVAHDSGWAYQVDGTYSEAFRSHDAARKAAEKAAREQRTPGDEAAISYEDANGHWHQELVHSGDQPDTEVEG
jgi:hypothetical protein